MALILYHPIPFFSLRRGFASKAASDLLAVLERGAVGQTYLIGGGTELTNLELVERICDLVDARAPCASGNSRRR